MRPFDVGGVKLVGVYINFGLSVMMNVIILHGKLMVAIKNQQFTKGSIFMEPASQIVIAGHCFMPTSFGRVGLPLALSG